MLWKNSTVLVHIKFYYYKMYLIYNKCEETEGLLAKTLDPLAHIWNGSLDIELSSFVQRLQFDLDHVTWKWMGVTYSQGASNIQSLATLKAKGQKIKQTLLALQLDQPTTAKVYAPFFQRKCGGGLIIKKQFCKFNLT